jgi:hypothetical protein
VAFVTLAEVLTDVGRPQIEVEVGLVMKEPVPAVLLRFIIPGPVGPLGIAEDEGASWYFCFISLQT